MQARAFKAVNIGLTRDELVSPYPRSIPMVAVSCQSPVKRVGIFNSH